MDTCVLPAFVAVASLVFTTAVPAAAGDRDVRAATPPPDRVVVEIAVRRVEQEGFAALAAGALATLRTDLSHVRSNRTFIHRFAGPLDDSWNTSDEIPEADLLWSSCTAVRPMGISTLLTAQRRPASPNVLSFFVVQPYTILRLTWRTCP